MTKHTWVTGGMADLANKTEDRENTGRDKFRE